MRRQDAHTLDLEVRRDELGIVRVREGELPQLRDGEVLLPPTAKGLAATANHGDCVATTGELASRSARWRTACNTSRRISPEPARIAHQ
jgi:hypothetical protein